MEKTLCQQILDIINDINKDVEENKPFDTFLSKKQQIQNNFPEEIKQFLNEILEEIENLIIKEIPKYIEQNKYKIGIKQTYKVVKNLLQKVVKFKKVHKHKQLTFMYLSIEHMRDDLFIQIQATITLNTRIDKMVQKDYLDNLLYDIMNWKHKLIQNLDEEEQLRIQRYWDNVQDKTFIYFLEKIKAYKYDLNLIAILFNKPHKRDFINLTLQQQSDFFNTIVESLKKYFMKEDIIEKIILDPSKGLFTLCYYCCFIQNSQKENFLNIMEIIEDLRINIKIKIESYFLKNYEKQIKQLIFKILKIKEKQKEYNDLDYIISEYTCDDKCDDSDYILSENNTLIYSKSNIDYIEKYLLYKNPHLLLLKTQDPKNFLEKNVDADEIFYKIKPIISQIFDNKWYHHIPLYDSYFYTSYNYTNYIFTFNKENKINYNLISLLFADKKLNTLLDLPKNKHNLFFKFLFQNIKFPEKFLASNKIFYESICHKILSDKTSGIALFQFYTYKKPPKELLSRKEIYQIKKTIIKFQFDNDIEIFDDFINKNPKLLKYCDFLTGDRN